MDAAAWDARYAEQPLVWSAGPNRTVAAELAQLRPGRALDLGAGEGRNALWLAERGWDVTATDFSAVAIDKGMRTADRRGLTVTWCVSDVTTTRPRRRAYDLVLLSYLQIPRAVQATVHTAAAEAVAPGGVLLLVAHDRTNLTRGHGGPQDADVLCDPDEVAGHVRAAGLVVERAERIERTVPTDDGDRTAIDTVVRAHRPAAG